MENNKKSVKPGKAPGSLKKPIKETKFQKYYLKSIEHPKDKEFFEKCFEKQNDTYVIRDNLSADEVKKLKEIVKWVKKNHKGAVKVVPLIFAAAVVAALVIFFTVFANPLLERALELGLEAAFEAKSDVDNFRLSLSKFSISIGGITVANRDAPMTNLFEMGKINITLKPEAVLRGKVYIEEISAANIQFGTERKTSGALIGKPPKEKTVKEKTETEGPPMIDLANFDAKALLNQEFDKLETPKLYDNAINFYNETSTKYKDQVTATKAKAEELKTKSQPLLNMSITNISGATSVQKIENAKKIVEDITSLVKTAQSAADDATKIVSGMESDIKTAQQLEQNARNSITKDINHLKSLVDIGGGGAFAALEPYIRDILSDSANQYLDYGLRALDVLEMLRAQAALKPKTEKTEKVEKPKKEKKAAFKGRDVIYPVNSYPTFYLGKLASNITQGSWAGDFDLRNISSDPELTYRQTGKPVSLTLGVAENSDNLKRQVKFEGEADLRENPPKKFSAAVNANGFPVSLGEQLSKAGINGFTGNAEVNLNVVGYNDGGILFNSPTNKKTIMITDPKLLNPTGTIAEAAATAVKEAGRIDIDITYTHKVDQSDEFKITTNFADLLAKAMKNIADAYAKKAMDEVEKALRERINQYIDGRFASKEDIDALLKLARGDKAAMDQIKNSLNNKQKEFENMASAAATEAAKQAAEDLLKGQAPSIPSIPGAPALKNPFSR